MERRRSQTALALAIVLAASLAAAGYGTARAQETQPANQEEKDKNSEQKDTAKEQDQQDVFKLDQITVSATKTERSTFDTPGEVSVITSEEIDHVQARSLDDVFQYLPGVDMANGPRRIGEEPVIRGLSGGRVLTMIDGARLNFASGHRGSIFQDVDILEQVEVVRGPASALYGSGALGGVISLTTKDPSDLLGPEESIGGSAKFGYQGAYGEYMTGNRIVGRLGKGLEFLVSYTGRWSGDIRLGGDAGTLENSSERLNTGFGKVVWNASPFDKVTVSVNAFLEDGPVPTNTATDTNDPALVVDRDTKQFTYQIGYRHANPDNRWLNLDAKYYYTQADISEKRASDGRPVDIDFGTFGVNLRNSMTFGKSNGKPSWMRNTVTYGVEWFQDRQSSSGDDSATTFFPDARMDYVGLYVQDELTTLGDRLIFIPGLRWDYYDTEGVDSNNRVSGKAGVVYKATDFLNLEANYSGGFRAARFGELFISGTHFPGAIFVPNPNLKPETSHNIDVGFRVKLDGVVSENDAFTFRNAYFRNSVKDFIDFDVGFIPPFGPLTFQAVNISDALIQGYEMEWAWQFYRGFQLSGNYTYTWGTNQETGEGLASVPPQKGVITLSYFHQPWDLLVGFRSIITGPHDHVPADVERTPGYAVFNFLGTWEPRNIPLLKNFRIDFGIDNLANRNYRRYLSEVPEPGINPKIAIAYKVGW